MPTCVRAPAFLALALAVLGCERLEPGEIGTPSYWIRGWEVVSEERVDRSWFQYALRGTCWNAGGPTAGAAAIAVSRSPHTVIVEDQLRCGPLAADSHAPSLDTITVRHDRTHPFDPDAITGVALVWAPETLARETRVDRTRFDYEYWTYLINGTDEEQDVVATVTSGSPDVEIIDDTVTGRVPTLQRLASPDGFTIRYERARPYDPDTLEWRLRLGTLQASADVNGDGVVDDGDRAFVEACLGEDPRRSCPCAAADLDGDGTIGAADLALVEAQLGRSGLPVRPPDTTPPGVVVTAPAPGADPGPPPVAVTGTVDEALFRLRVNGVETPVAAGAPPLAWSAQAPLPAGAPAIVVQALDLACNERIVRVPLAAGEDHLPPVVRLVAPAQVGAGAALRVVADAQDDVGVAAVELLADGVSLGERGTAPFVFDLVAPATPGAALALRAVARDTAGNTGEASATVLVVAQDAPDAPPSVGALLLPPSVTPGATFRAAAEASDDRGVAEVRFLVPGGGSATALTPPYEVELVAPADAPVGSQLAVEVEAVDGAGQTARASGSVAVVAAPDETPPSVALQAPAEATPGAEVLLAATAQDDGGVASLRFRADGIEVARRSAPPFEAHVPLPAGRAPGEIVVWTAVAVDFAGNTAESEPVVTLVVPPAAGFAAGEVYDDATSRPLAGARVRALKVAGSPAPDPALEATSDERGAYRLALPEGPALLEIRADGYTPAWRRAEVPARGVVTPLDARLAPRAAASALLRADGGAVETPDGAARLAVPPGALAADGEIAFTRTSPQALPLPLPLGWTPLAAFELAVPAELAAPVSVALLDAALAAAPVAARLDAQAAEWRAVAIESEGGSAPRVTLPAAGTVVLARPDALPAAPPLPGPGEALAGVDPAAIPADASATLLPSPRVVFAATDARAEVTVRLDAVESLPSGTPIEVRFREAYEQTDGGRLEPPPSGQDFLLFQEPSGPAAHFVAAPVPGLDPVLLAEGVIELTARARPVDAAQVLGPAGGQIETPDGVALEIAPGALAGETPAAAERLAPVALGLAEDDRYEVLGGLDLDLGGASLASAGVLRFPLAQPLAAGEQILLVRSIPVLGRAELELVGVATLSGNEVVVGAGGLGLPLPGVRAGGRYALVRMRAPVGFVSGEVTRPGTPAADALVRADTLPFVGRARAGEPRYAVAAALGETRVEALDLTNGDGADGTATLAAAGEVAALDLALATRSLAVGAVEPADGSPAVAVGSVVVLRFSAPLDPTTLDGDAVQIQSGGAPLAASLALQPDRLRVVLRPVSPLVGATLHEVRVGLDLRDVFGRPLAAPFASAFTTVDTTAPPRPAPGAITLSIPVGGLSEVTGSPGSVPPGSLLVVSNETRGTTASVLAGVDGAFFVRVAADAGDVIRLRLVGPGGEVVDLDPIPFSDGAGGFVLGPEGGVASSAAGVVARWRPRALRAPGLVRLRDRAVEELAGETPPGVTVALGFGLEFEPELLNEAVSLEVFEANARFPERSAFATPLRVEATHLAPPVTGPASRFTFRARSRDAAGVERLVAVEAEGRATACAETRSVRDDAAEPVLDLTAPSCLGPDEVFTLRAEARQPRIGIEAPRPAGAPSEATWLVVEERPLGGELSWRVIERLGPAAGDVGRLATDPAAPFGLREPGDYWIAAVAADLAWLEGHADGAVLVAAEGSPFVATAGAAGGAFLLPVPAGQSLALLRLDPASGAELSRTAVAALAPGETRRLARLGVAGAPALDLVLEPDPEQQVHGRAPLAFEFSEPVAAESVTPAGIAVTDASGRSVAGRRRLVGDGSRVELLPDRPWRFGESYAWRVTTEVAGLGGARLAEDRTGSFTGFGPAVAARLPGSDVRDAAVQSPVAWALDAGRLRPLDLTDPAAPNAGTALELGAAASRLLRTEDAGGALLLAAGGAGGEYGSLQRIGIASPLQPVLAATRRLSTPPGAPTLSGVATQPGIPTSLAAADAAAVVASQGIGLQRLPLAGGLGPPPPELPLQHPPGGGSFTAVAAAEGWLVSVAGGALALHDPATLLPLASATITGTARDVTLARVGGRLLALVAAGLPGGVQVFALERDEPHEGDPSAPAAHAERVAQVLTGCAVSRVAADAPLGRGWFVCTNGRLGAIDLRGGDGLDPIDLDRDGRDDRLAGLVDLALLPSSPLALTLDVGRALGLVSAGAAGLVVAALGPAEALITDVRRDVLPGDRDDEVSILASGRAFHGDQALEVAIEARIPPGHPGLRAQLEGDAPFAFAGGGREQPLAPGANVLQLVPSATLPAGASAWRVRVLAETAELAAVAGSFEPVPLDALVSIDADDVSADGAAPQPIVISGVDGADVRYNLTPLARFELLEPALGTVGDDGTFVPAAGGSGEIAYEVAGRRQSLLATATLPPAVAALALDPELLHLREGERATLSASGELTDGTLRALAAAADGLVFESSDAAVVAVDGAGALEALAPGVASIQARAPSGAEAFAQVEVTRFVAPDLTGLALELEAAAVSTDDAAIGAQATLSGTGSLDRIAVEFRLDVPGGSSTSTVETGSDGTAVAVFEGLEQPGSGTITARAVDPGDGDVFQETGAFDVAHRNRDGEPNDTRESAVELRSAVPVNGQVGGADPADFYRLTREVPGAWTLALTGAGAQAALVDETGAVIGSVDADGPPLTREVPASTQPLFVRVTAAEPADYTVTVAFAAAAPVIEGIEPASAPPGATVSIRGRGFSPVADRNLVFFQGLRTEIVATAPDRLDVVVPAFATDGPVVVWVDSEQSNERAFATGAPHWYPQATRVEFTADDLVLDDESGSEVVRDRVEASFRPTVLRARVEEIAAQLGAEIVGVWPPRNAYEFRFPVTDLTSLRARQAQIDALPEVRYTRLLILSTIEAFPIAGRDDWPGRQTPASPSAATDARRAGAYAQIRAFEAWQWLADSGFFREPSDFGTVHVGVIDMGILTTAASIPQMKPNQVLIPLDLNVIANAAVDSHGMDTSALIGAANVEDASRRSTGILGGVVPPDAPPPFFYTVDLYDAALADGNIDDREEELALGGCVGAPALPDGTLPPCATLRPMDVVNMSYGHRLTAGSGSVQYYADLMRSRPDTLFVASAGNENKTAFKHMPSSMSARDLTGGAPQVRDRVISVAAVGTGWRRFPKHRRADVRSSFSNFGKGVDIAAPGENVLTVATTPDKTSSCRPGTLPANSTFDFFCGTSAAAPLVAGTAALMKAVSPSLTAAELKTLLIESATPLRGVTGAVSWGAWSKPRRLDVLRAVQLAMRHRAAASGGVGAPADYLPGERRYLWIPDRPNSRLVRARIEGFFERSLSDQEITIDAPVDVGAANCPQPYAVQTSASGAKVYVACRGTDQILVWFANTNEEADFTASPRVESRIPLQIGSSSYGLPFFPSIQMALNRDGQILAIPLRGRRVAFLDTRTDRIVDVKKLHASADVGELRALAFGADDTLYALTSDGFEGRLARKARSSTMARWRIDQAAGLAVRSVGEPFASPPSRGPTGLAVFPQLGADQVYVLYGQNQSAAAATVHRGSNLALLDPPGGANGRIRANLPGRVAQTFKAGDLVGLAIGSFTVFERLLRTATTGVEGMAIDPQRGHAYMAFFDTGNLAHLKQHPGSESFQELASATRILGDFDEPRIEQQVSLQSSLRADGSIDTQVASQLAGRDSRLYFQDAFPVSFATDQEGGVLAAHLTGLTPRLRVWSTHAIREGQQVLDQSPLDPADTTLEEALAAGFVAAPLFADFEVGAQSAPSLAFGNALSVSAPGAGAITRGVVAVHPVISDPKIEHIRCEVRRASNGALVRSDAGSAVTPGDAKAGLPTRTGAGGTGTPVPVCRFRDLPRGAYVLRVIGTTSLGNELVHETPFLHEAW